MPKVSMKDRLLHVATRLFAENGYKAVTVRDINDNISDFINKDADEIADDYMKILTGCADKHNQ